MRETEGWSTNFWPSRVVLRIPNLRQMLTIKNRVIRAASSGGPFRRTPKINLNMRKKRVKEKSEREDEDASVVPEIDAAKIFEEEQQGKEKKSEEMKTSA